jgi:hypothetical protein
MTELEFIDTNPTNYGQGNANLLISSSVSGSELVPTPPYHIQGITVPFKSLDNVDVETALGEINTINFEFTEGVVNATVTAKRKKGGYFFMRVKDFVVNTLPTTFDTAGNYTYENSAFVFIPYVAESFTNNDFNPLQGEAQQLSTATLIQVVDRISSQNTPTNLPAIVTQTAEPASLQDCNYTKIGVINGRYNGTKLTSGSIFGDDPALVLREFKGSIHDNTSNSTAIAAIDDTAREVENIFFTPHLSGSGPGMALSSFPSVNDFLYGEENNRFVKIVKAKVYAIDKDNIITTDEVGKVTNIS